eukprot:gene7037-biopygen4309
MRRLLRRTLGGVLKDGEDATRLLLVPPLAVALDPRRLLHGSTAADGGPQLLVSREGKAVALQIDGGRCAACDLHDSLTYRRLSTRLLYRRGVAVCSLGTATAAQVRGSTSVARKTS